MTIGEQMTASLSLDQPQFARQWAAMMERLERTGADLREALLRLTAIASGRRIKVGDYGGDVRTDDSGIVDLVFTDNQTPDTIWRLVAVHAATCVFLGIEHVRPDAAQRFFPMLARMCASNPSELKGCRESSSSFVLRKEETP